MGTLKAANLPYASFYMVATGFPNFYGYGLHCLI